MTAAFKKFSKKMSKTEASLARKKNMPTNTQIKGRARDNYTARAERGERSIL